MWIIHRFMKLLHYFIFPCGFGISETRMSLTSDYSTHTHWRNLLTENYQWLIDSVSQTFIYTPHPPTRLTLAVFLCCSLVASFLFCCCWNTKDLSAVLSRPPYTTAMPLEEKDCAATYKILILGENSVGKTAILNSLVGRDFKSSVLPTSGKPFGVSFHRNPLLFER